MHSVLLLDQIIYLSKSVLMLEHLVHDVQQAMSFESWSRALHEIALLLDSARVCDAVIDELAELL